jgi:hypothetical protein
MSFLSGLSPAQESLFAAIFGQPGRMPQQPQQAPAAAPKSGGGGGFLGGLGRGLQRAFDPSSIAMSQALMAGDYGAAATMGAQQRQLRARQEQAQAEAEADAQLRAQAAQALEAEGFDKSVIQGMSPQDISGLLRDMYQDRQFGSGGGSVRRAGRGPGQAPTYDMAPSRHEYQGSVFDVPGGAGEPVLRRPGHQIVPLQPGGEAAVFNSYTGEEVTGGRQQAPQGAPPGMTADEINRQADEAIRAGRDPAMVNRRRQQLLGQGGAGSGAPAPFDAGFDPVSAIQSSFGVRPTSGYRTPGHQADLVRQGLTSTRYGSHQRGDGVDWPTPRGMTKQQFIAQIQQQFPGARAIPSNGNSVHVTFPGWGGAPDVSGSRRRYPIGGR